MLRCERCAQWIVVRRAFAMSSGVVALFIALEYILLLGLRQDGLLSPIPSEIVAFVVADKSDVAAFVLADDGSLTDQVPHRYRLGLVDTRSGRLRGKLLALPEAPKDVLAHSTLSGILVGCWDGSLVHVDPRDPTSPATHFAKHPTGFTTRLLYVAASRTMIGLGRRNSIAAWHVDTGELLWQRTLTGYLAAAADERQDWLYCGLDSGTVLRLEASTGRTLSVCTDYDRDVIRLTISPDGQSLAAVLLPNRLVVTEVHNGHQLWTDRISSFSQPVFSADGTRLIFADNEGLITRLVIVDARTGRRLSTLSGHRGYVLGACCTNDGKLYSWGSDGCLIAWDLTENQPLWTRHPASELGPQAVPFLVQSGVHSP